MSTPPKYRTVSLLDAYKLARLVERRQKIEAQIQLMQSQAQQLQMQLADTTKNQEELLKELNLTGVAVGTILIEPANGLPEGTILDGNGAPILAPETPIVALVPPPEPPAA